MRRSSKLDNFEEVYKMLASNKEKSEEELRIRLCQFILNELENLTAVDLSGYLKFYGINFSSCSVDIDLSSPIQAHIFNPLWADVEGNK